MARRNSWQQNALYAQAFADAYRIHNPSIETEKLHTQAFVAAWVRVRSLHGVALPASEPDLYTAVFAARQEREGRLLSSHEQRMLRDATMRIWAAWPGLTNPTCNYTCDYTHSDKAA